jgi:hypothetical protein
MRELVDSRKALMSIPNAEPDLFAFPFESYNPQLTTLCRSVTGINSLITYAAAGICQSGRI